MRPTKVLFLLKRQGAYGSSHPPGWDCTASGIGHSVAFIVDMLHELGIDAKLEIMQDGNSIDKAVTEYQPTHVIIEALWVTPAKLAQLTRLHPSVHWNIRLHSELPFLSLEGMAMQWLFAYIKLPHVSISTNSARGQADYEKVLFPQGDEAKPPHPPHPHHHHVQYTPNYYPLFPLEDRKVFPADKIVDVGCFGAVRPLKNQLTQAVAAIDWANDHHETIRFHMNTDRVEMSGDNVLKNLRALFANSQPHTLIEHKWLDRAEFMALVGLMDIGMQVSFSETFNIVSADFATSNVPLVVSHEVTWVAPIFQALATSTDDISRVLQVAWLGRQGDLQQLNYQGLRTFDAAATRAWPVALTEMA